MVHTWASRGTSRRARRRRELVLMRASARLGAATSSEEIQSAAVDTVMAMLPATRGVRATLFRGNDQTMAFVAAAGDHPDDVLGFEVTLQPHVRERLLAGEPIDASHVTSDQRAASPHPAKLGDLFSVPLFIQGELRGALMVTADGRLPHAFEDSFRTLASHVALALERAELTADLRRSEERFRALVQNASDIVTVVDVEGRIMYESPSVERILGYDAAGLEGRPILDIVHPADVEAPAPSFLKALRTGDVTAPVCWRVRPADGPGRHVGAIYKKHADDPHAGASVLPTRHVN